MTLEPVVALQACRQKKREAREFADDPAPQQLTAPCRKYSGRLPAPTRARQVPAHLRGVSTTNRDRPNDSVDLITESVHTSSSWRRISGPARHLRHGAVIAPVRSDKDAVRWGKPRSRPRCELRNDSAVLRDGANTVDAVSSCRPRMRQRPVEHTRSPRSGSAATDWVARDAGHLDPRCSSA